ncbi:hypothetical protein ACR80S_12355 [Halomonas sp. MA07-2]|uniref:hypothetical protein n=1 Tax=Halomonas sp. MA07-2 TaxID=3440841 RepID=UPI003EEFED36
MTTASPETAMTSSRNETNANQLVLVNLSSRPCEAWLNAVRAAGQPWHPEIVDNLAKAKLLLNERSGIHALICYDMPDRQVASCIAEGRLPSQALANWRNATEVLLDLYRNSYQRITLVARDALEGDAKVLFSQLAARTGISLGRVPTETAEEVGTSAPQQRAALQLLAQQALQLSSARCVLQELEASSLPLIEPADPLDVIDMAYETLKSTILDAREPGETQKEHETLQEENELLIAQLQRIQEELELYLQGNKGKGNTERVNELKLDKLQQIIKQKNEKLHSFSQKNKQLAAKLHAARKELKALRDSKSWKVTAPLRKTMQVLGSGKGGNS